jgi:isopropylmalate/homocitrate/citramalate synthase
LVGQDNPVAVIGKGSGVDNVKHHLENHQIKYTEEQAMEVLMAVKDWGLVHKRLMKDDEFKKLAEEILAD